MEQAVALFANLIIAFLGIFNPIMILLLNMYKEGVKVLEKKFKSKKKYHKEILRVNIESMEGATLSKLTKAFANEENRHEKKLKLMNPKRLMKHLVFPQLIAFILIELFFIYNDKEISIDIPYCSRFYCLIIAVILFGYSIFVIFKVVNTVIEVQADIKTKKYDDKTSPTPTGNPTQHG